MPIVTSTNGNHQQVTETEAGVVVCGAGHTPAETWAMMLRFSAISPAEQEAMRQTVDILFQHGYELVVATYDHLRDFPETAEVLGWQEGVEEAHLAERRRFFTIWLARTLSMDFGTQFGDYLAYAGKVHAAYGARQIETPSMWITGSVGLIIGAFARFINMGNFTSEQVGLALSGWNKYLLVQLNQMHMGYDVGKAMQRGEHQVEVKAYAMVRHHWGRDRVTVRFNTGECVEDALRKLLDFAPELRAIMFDEAWDASDREQDLWLSVKRQYKLKAGWRVQLNGKNLTFHGGFDQLLQPDDVLTLFSPGR